MARRVHAWACPLPCACWCRSEIKPESFEVVQRREGPTHQKTYSARSLNAAAAANKLANTVKRPSGKCYEDVKRSSGTHQDLDSCNLETASSQQGSRSRDTISTWSVCDRTYLEHSTRIGGNTPTNAFIRESNEEETISVTEERPHHYARGQDTFNGCTNSSVHSSQTETEASRMQTDHRDGDGRQEQPSVALASPLTQQMETKHATAISKEEKAMKPLENAMTLLQQMASHLEINDQESVLEALLLLRRGLRHHSEVLIACLRELVDIVVVCLHSPEDTVIAAALAAAADLFAVFKDSMLQFLASEEDHQSLIIHLLLLAASRGKAKRIRSAADSLLRYAATKLHQPSMVSILETLGEHPSLRLKAKSREYLLIATYRLS